MYTDTNFHLEVVLTVTKIIFREKVTKVDVYCLCRRTRNLSLGVLQSVTQSMDSWCSGLDYVITSCRDTGLDQLLPEPHWGTHCNFSTISQRVLKRDAQSEVILFGAEVAGFYDVKLVPILLDGDLQVVVLRQLALHDVNTLVIKQKNRNMLTECSLK